MGASTRPVLIVNPATDRHFAAESERQLDAGAYDLEAFEVRLRRRYPQAVVHPRELSGESMIVWYVYRDGRWMGSRLRDGDR
jgi:hypothetical protein